MVDDILENLYKKIYRGIKLQPLITKSINDDVKFTYNKTMLKTLDIFPLISFTSVNKKKYFCAWNIALVVEL